MTAKKTKTQRTTANRQKARKTAQRSANRAAAMSEDERKALAENILDRHAPTVPSAKSDLLIALQVIGLAFVRKYYPDATAASFHVAKYGDLSAGRGGLEYSASLPVPVAAD